MLFRKEVKALARQVAKDLRAGRPTERSQRATEFMIENPSAIVGAIDLARREANRERPDDALIHAYRELIGNGLDALRMLIEAGDDWAETLVDGIREMLLNLGESEEISPALLILLLQAFVHARLEPGDDLTELMGDLLGTDPNDEPEFVPAKVDEALRSIVVEARGNEFEIHACLMETGATLPPDVRAGMATALAAAETPALRDCAMLFLLDPKPPVRGAICQAIGDSGSLVSPKALRRMIAARNWLPAKDRPALDDAIRKIRQAGVDCAQWPQSDVTELLATPEDGGGAQSVFAIAKDGRKHLFGALLVKRNVGIADVWCLRGQTKAEIRRLLGRIRDETDSVSVGADFVRRLISHHVATGLRDRRVPAPGLLEFIEAAGLNTCQPAVLGPDAILGILQPEVAPNRMTPDAIAGVLERSCGWIDEFRFMDSWFEGGSEVEAALSNRRAADPSARIRAVLRSVLEPSRRKWTDRFLWTALLAKEQSDLLSPWDSFFVIGRELHKGRPMSKIPVMRAIAQATVAATMDELP